MDQEHLNVLKQGAEAWNIWRKENPDIEPDLSLADLFKELYSIYWNIPKEVHYPWIRRDSKESGPCLNDIDFSYCDLHRVNLRGAYLAGADFRNANLREVCLTDAFLVGADMRDCYLSEACLEEAHLSGVDFRGAILAHSNMRSTHLSDANIQNANLRYADLSGAVIHGITYNSKTQFRGIDVSGIKGCPSFKRFAQDQDYVEELRETKWKKPIYWLWKATSNCGRSLIRWVLWACIFAFSFGLWFYSLGENAFHSLHLPWSFWTALYYSVVTFTTLGFGDITPMTSSAALAVAIEVIIGYVMLGGLVTLFASRMVRRA